MGRISGPFGLPRLGVSINSGGFGDTIVGGGLAASARRLAGAQSAGQRVTLDDTVTAVEIGETGTAGFPQTVATFTATQSALYQVVGRLALSTVVTDVTVIRCNIGVGQPNVTANGGVISVAWVGLLARNDDLPVIVEHNGSDDGTWNGTLAVTRLP